MKIFNSRLVALTTAALLVLSACGSSPSSTRSRNSVLAGGPCVSASQVVGTTVEVSFCAGAVRYSKDNGETLIDVPKGVLEIAGNMWPESEGMVFKFGIMSYDQAGTLIGDDVVTRTVKSGCEFGNYCNNGETGPNGGTIVLSKTTPSIYYEIMPIAEGFATNQLITAKEVAAANIDAPWQLPTVVALSDILNSTLGEKISDSRLANFRFEDGVSAVCDEMKQEKYCLFHPYWTTDSGTQYAPSTLPPSNDAAMEQIKTIGYDLWDYQGNDSIKQFCPLSDTSRSAGCLATLLPVHVYSPKKPSNTIAVEQVDRERWQELCTSAPEIAIGENEPGQNFSITVSHPCMATATREQPVTLEFKVFRSGVSGDEHMGDVDGLNKDLTTRFILDTPNNKGKTLNYNLPDGRYFVRAQLTFPRVGDLDTSETHTLQFDVGPDPFSCQPEDLKLINNQLSTTCEGATGLSLNYMYGVDATPRVGEPSKSVTLEMPDGWHMFEVLIFSKTSQFGQQMWACLADCGPKAVRGLTVTAVREDVAIASTTQLTCEEGIFSLIGQGSPNGNPNLLSYVGPREVITSAEQVIAKPASGIYMYMINPCEIKEESMPEIGLVFAEAVSSDAKAPDLSEGVIARTQVMDIDRNDGRPVIATATNTIMEIMMGDMKDVASMSISMNGATTNLSAGAQPTLVNIPADATSMKIITKKKNGAVEVYTKAISRPTQLPTAASAVPTQEKSSRNVLPWILIILALLLILLALLKYRKQKESL